MRRANIPEFRRCTVATASPTCGSPPRRCRRRTSRLGSRRCAAPGRCSIKRPMPHWRSRARPCRRRPTGRLRTSSSSTSSTRQYLAPAKRAPAPARWARAPAQRAPTRRGAGRSNRQEADMLGRLTWAAIPFDQPIALVTGLVVIIVVLAVLALVTVRGWWPYLWREWITSVDHKRIGVMYVALGLIMLVRGFADAIMMRTQQAIAIGDAQGYLPPDHYDQIFTAHGVIMIFFVAMPLVIGLMNFVV